MSDTPKVYAAISAVAADLAKTGIDKAEKNKFDNYFFRGIDAVYNHLAPILPKYGLVILPRYTNREVVERTSAKGGALFYVTVHGEFDFVSVEDGSKHTVHMDGEAMDRGDKATNKAMSAAYKYACFQVFCIPTEGDNDADAATHEVAPDVIAAEEVCELREAIKGVGGNEAALVRGLKGSSLETFTRAQADAAWRNIDKKREAA